MLPLSVILLYYCNTTHVDGVFVCVKCCDILYAGVILNLNLHCLLQLCHSVAFSLCLAGRACQSLSAQTNQPTRLQFETIVFISRSHSCVAITIIALHVLVFVVHHLFYFKLNTYRYMTLIY